jgi:hypothetical protein
VGKLLVDKELLGKLIESIEVPKETSWLEPRWILVSERLPDKDKYYPCLLNGWDNWVTRRFDKSKSVFLDDDPNQVTHWFELPEEK